MPLIYLLLGLVAAVQLANLALNTSSTLVHRRAMREIPKQLTAEDVIAGAQALAKLAEPTDVLGELLLHRYIVTLRDEGMFGGVMVDAKAITTPTGQQLLVYYFDQCATLPKHDGDTPAEIAGRVILESSGISYLQQVG